MTLPNTLVAGDSLSSLESWSAYPATDGWVLTFVLVNASTKYTVASTPEGDDHRITASGSTTASWEAGDYSAILLATNGDERSTLCVSITTIKPDPIASATLDGRGAATKTLAALRAAYDSMIATGGMVQSVEVNGRKTQFRTADDILQQISFWERQVQSEVTAQNLKNGLGFGGRILTRL